MSGYKHTQKELTDKQKEVMYYVAQGLSNSKIAKEMNISRDSAGEYVGRITLKLGLLSKAELKQYAIDNGYLEQEVSHE